MHPIENRPYMYRPFLNTIPQSHAHFTTNVLPSKYTKLTSKILHFPALNFNSREWIGLLSFPTSTACLITSTQSLVCYSPSFYLLSEASRLYRTLMRSTRNSYTQLLWDYLDTSPKRAHLKNTFWKKLPAWPWDCCWTCCFYFGDQISGSENHSSSSSSSSRDMLATSLKMHNLLQIQLA